MLQSGAAPSDVLGSTGDLSVDLFFRSRTPNIDLTVSPEHEKLLAFKPMSTLWRGWQPACC
jgi:hypothetical protein